MVKLTPTLFSAQPRKELQWELDRMLNTLIANLTGYEISDQDKIRLIRIQSELGLVQTLKSLVLPNPTKTYLLPRKQLPEAPLSFRQLKAWRDTTILKYTRLPHSDDYTTLVARQHTLYLLTHMEFKDDGTIS